MKSEVIASIFELLSRIQANPALFVDGDPSIKRLRSFLAGILVRLDRLIVGKSTCVPMIRQLRYLIKRSPARLRLLAAMLIFTSCRPNDRALVLKDVTKVQRFELHPASGKVSDMSVIALKADGFIDGEAMLVPYLYSTQRLSGPVHLALSHDVSATNYILTYIPVSVKGGSLTIKWALHK
jgi:hypothetical protein